VLANFHRRAVETVSDPLRGLAKRVVNEKPCDAVRSFIGMTAEFAAVCAASDLKRERHSEEEREKKANMAELQGEAAHWLAIYSARAAAVNHSLDADAGFLTAHYHCSGSRLDKPEPRGCRGGSVLREQDVPPSLSLPQGRIRGGTFRCRETEPPLHLRWLTHTGTDIGGQREC